MRHDNAVSRIRKQPVCVKRSLTATFSWPIMKAVYDDFAALRGEQAFDPKAALRPAMVPYGHSGTEILLILRLSVDLGASRPGRLQESPEHAVLDGAERNAHASLSG
jgi:hypothetical protein